MNDREKNSANADLGARCAGCGITLQSTDAQSIGYTPEQALERQPVICQRCYRMKHYNEASNMTVHQDEFLKILSHIGSTRALVVNIVDIFDFEGSMIAGLHRFVGRNPVLLLLNKMDLLPKTVSPNRVMNWAQQQAKELGLKVAGVVPVSARTSSGFDRAVEEMERQRRKQDVYVVGATNVGKSTFINKLISEFSDLGAELTVSSYPGTTLDMVKIPLEDGHFIIDTPGIVYEYRLSEIVPKRDLGTIVPDKPLRPAVYQLNPGQTLFFGGLARFDFVKGERQSFTCYKSNVLDIHRTKWEKADELYEMHVGEMLSPPDLDGIAELPPLTKYAFHIKEPSDIYISGLGWIKANGSRADIAVHVPEGVKVVIRKPLI